MELAKQLENEAKTSYDEWTEQAMRTAIVKFRSAVSHWQSAGNSSAALHALIKIGDIYTNLGEYRNALLSYEEALSLARSPEERSKCLNSITSVHIYLGDHVKALAFSRRAYQLSHQINNRREQARALNNQGEIYYDSGDPEKAAESLKTALALWPEGEAGGIDRIFLNLGYTAFDRRDMDQALSNYKKALEHARSGNNKRNEALALTAMGGVYSYLGNKQTALDYHNQALKLFQRIGDRNGEGVTLNGLGYFHMNVAEYQKSLDSHLSALKLFQDLGNREYESFTLTCVGRAYQGLEDNARALEYFHLALDRAVIYSQTKATALNAIGEIFETMGQPRKALVYYGQALHLYKVIDDPMGQASILNHLGNLSQASGKNVEALKHYRKALALSRSVQDPSGEASALLKIASALRASQDYVEARSQIEDAIQIIESLRMNVASQDSRASYLASTHQYYELYVDILMRLDQRNPNEGLAATAFEVSERGRARSFLESLREARSDIHEGIDASLSEQERRLGRELNIKAERHLQLVANKKTDLAKVVAKEIDQITAEYREVRAQIRLKNPRYAALTEPHPISLKEIQQQVLDDDSLLLEYMLGDDTSYLWAITRTEVATFELPGRATIEQSARSVYVLLTANQPLHDETLEETETRVAKANQQLSSQIAELSRILIQPVAAKLGTKRLLLVADGALQYLPFQILNEPTFPSPTESGTNAKVYGPAPLVASHEIVNEPSASALALLISQTKDRIPAPNSVAVLADPVFDADDPRLRPARTANANGMTALVPEGDLSRAVRDVPSMGSGSRIPRLLASLDEAKAITAAAPLWSSFKATGFEASRATALKPELGEYRFVHFATHGLLNDEHPELSGIVLSLVDKDGQPQDGFLRLHDIYNLHLPVELVVLSACNTGLGKDVRGEGLIGLTRGFMYAGASSVVASLWKVDDEATAELMKLFYAAMFREGLSPAAALRKAQLEMSQQKRWQSPYYWSGFIIQGQYAQTQRPAQLIPGRLIVLGSLAGLLLLTAFFIWKRRRPRRV